MSLFLLGFTFIAHSQIKEFEFNTGYTIIPNRNNYVFSKIELINDQLFFESFISSNNVSIDQRIRFELDTASLNSISSQILWDRNLKPILSKIIYGKVYYFPPIIKVLHDDTYAYKLLAETHTDTNQSLEIELFNYVGGVKLNIAYHLHLNDRILLSDPFLYDSTLFIFTSNIDNLNDSSFLYSYNLRNLYLDSNYFTYDGWPNNITFSNYEKSYGPTSIFKLNDSLLTFEAERPPQVQLINRFTLDTAGYIAVTSAQRLALINNDGWGDRYAAKYIYTDSSYLVSGTLVKNLSGSQLGFKYYYLEYGYNKTIIDKKAYGDDLIYQRGYGYTEKGGTRYLIGSKPFYNHNLEAAEMRQILIYKDSPQGLDSILLYGNKNHVGLTVEVDSKDNVYVLSQYTNAWSDDSLYMVVTKIPASMLTSIKKFDSKTTSLQIYPNPTTELVKLSTFNKGDVYYIYDIQGSIIKENYVPEDGVINVSSFTNGTYFIKLSRKGAISQRATAFIKQ